MKYHPIRPFTIIVILMIAVVLGTGRSLLKTRKNEFTSLLQSTQSSSPAPTTRPVLQTITQHSSVSYRNEQYGYQATYPPEFSVEDPEGNGSLILFVADHVDNLRVPLYTNLRKNANPKREVITNAWILHYLDTWYGSYYRATHSVPIQTLEEILIGGQTAVKVTEHDNIMQTASVNLFIPQDTDILEIHLIINDNFTREPGLMNRFINIFISTFTFTN